MQRFVGAVAAINGTTLTLKVEAGPEISVQVQDTTRILRVAPGQKDLTGATVVKLQDLQVGDRILVYGQPSPDGKSVPATRIIVMKLSDVQAKHQQDMQDWQKRGVGGLVSAVDAATRTITISVSGPGGPKTVAIHTTKDTVLRRYAPDSVKFDEAKPKPLEDIKPGDQLRARGNRSADGNEMTAEEIVSGSFRNIAGTITAIDVAAGTLNVMDAISKKPVVVKITADSQVRKLSPMMAQMIALRLKGGAAGFGGGDQASRGGGAGTASGAPPGGERGSGRGGGGGGDMQQMLSRLPAATLADLEKGEAVMIVSTEGQESGAVTAITLLGGVDPILRASPETSPAILLSPWNMNAGGEGGSQ